MARLNRIAWALALGFASACGGQSILESDDGKPSNGGAGGESGSGSGNTSGTFTGGTSSGGTFTGGTFTGGTFTGGTSSGGTFTGGTSFGGTGTGAVAGTLGTGGTGVGGVCSLPLVIGPCDAYVPSYGFSAADGNCQPFIYGGCQGNDNRFSTLAECEAKCGGSLSQCPERTPSDMCSSEGQICSYGDLGCLCAPQLNYACPIIDQSCVNADAGVAEIVVVHYMRCTCTSGLWNCQPVITGGR